jgi:diaminopimelate epimerase
MNLNFTKMHGAGNDFVIIDNTREKFSITPEFINKICNRTRCIGGDGLIALITPEAQNSEYNVIMEYYNRDGSRGEMCGNGLRCAAYYSNKVMGLPTSLKVKTDAGILEAEILGENKVKISIPVITEFEEIVIDGESLFYGNTGVPHAVVCVDDIENCDVFKKGRYLRFHETFEKGANVNFIKREDVNEKVKIRTYERGVETETFACGTGICASAISLNKFKKYPNKIIFETRDRDVLVVDIPDDTDFKKVYLTGSAEIAFHGKIEIK